MISISTDVRSLIARPDSTLTRATRYASFVRRQEEEEASFCQHSTVSYCVGQTDLKGEDVVFLEHQRPWPGRNEESFCSSINRGTTTFHEGRCSECGYDRNVYSLFCVFDGHNGRHAANHAAGCVRETLEKHLPRGNAPPIAHEDYEEWRGLIQRALAITLVELNGTFAAKGIHAGCTATIVLLTEWLVTCINLGDSHAYMDTGSRLIQLTSDHRVASNKLDRRRVELTGAIVAPVSMTGSGPADAYSPGLGPLRVWPGGLCISRAIGDFDVGPSIVPFGHITQTLIPSKGGRILIGSDGVWDAFHKKKKVGAMTRTWPLDSVPSKIISTIVRTHGAVKDDTSLVVVDVLPIGAPGSSSSGTTFPEMVAKSKKEGSTGSGRSLSMANGGGGGRGIFCSCFGGKPNGANGSVHGSAHGSAHGHRRSVDESMRGASMYDDSVRSGTSMKSLSSMNSRGWVGCVVDEVDVADVLDLMPSASQEDDAFLTVKPDWLVEELKEALLSAVVFATDSWMEASGRAPPKAVPSPGDDAWRPSRVSFAEQVSVSPSAATPLRRQSSEFFRDSVLQPSDSTEYGSRFGHYRNSELEPDGFSTRLADLPAQGPAPQDDDKETTPSASQGSYASYAAYASSIPVAMANAIADLSVRAGRVYNSEASVRAGAHFKTNVNDPSVRLRGSNMEGSVHMKAYDVDAAPMSPDSSNDGRKQEDGDDPKGILKTTTVRRGGGQR